MAINFKKKLQMAFLIYLRTLAKIQLAKNRPTVVGITGSAGKTSLRNAVQAILQDHFKVKTSIKANSETGIPMNILGIKPRDFTLKDWLRIAILAPVKLLTNWERYQIYIAELGIDSPHPPKNMEYLLTIIKPKVGVFLNALPVHSQYFDSLVPEQIANLRQRRKVVLDLIANQKGKLITSLPKAGTAVLNLDDSRVAGFTNKTSAKVISISTKKPATLKAKNISVSLKGFSMKVKEKKSQVKLKLPFLLDEHFSQTFLAAIAVGRAFNIPLESCVGSLTRNFKIPAGRMSVIPGIKNSTILDSSYNASKATMISALKLLNKVARKRKVAVLGDMRELGKVGKLEHQELAKVASQTADFIITVGPMMENWFTPGLLKSGFKKQNILNFSNPFKAVIKLRKLVKTDDTILIKGSQNTLFLEIIVESLMKNSQKAGKLLCRREPIWQKKRQALKTSNHHSQPPLREWFSQDT